MKRTPKRNPSGKCIPMPFLRPTFIAVALLCAACNDSQQNAAQPIAVGASIRESTKLSAWEFALASPHPHASLADEISTAILALQQSLRDRRDQPAQFERLGWLFVSLARRTRDEGFYAQAEACANCLATFEKHASDAQLLRGHVAFARHDFAAALRLAERLCAERGAAFDHGLRGDALLELGRIDDAEGAYQRMLDEKPCLQSYARAGVLCASRGELEPALELLEMACKAASPRDAEAAAWAYGEWSRLLAWNGEVERALQTLDVAENYLPAHAPTLLLRARLLGAKGDLLAARDAARQALAREESVEARWLLADLERALRNEAAAQQCEGVLESPRMHLDARSLTHYYATRAGAREAALPANDVERAQHVEQTKQALSLARTELATRDGAATRAALALALWVSGDREELRAHLELASAAEACDPRIRLAIGLCLSERDPARSRAHLELASRRGATLLPSERAILESALESLSHPSSLGVSK